MFTVRRSTHNPILSPDRSHSWEEVSSCNGCPIKVGDTTYVLYRAIAKPDPMSGLDLDQSIVAVAETIDGEHYTNRRPLITPVEEWEKYGCEDPRVTFMDGKFYIFYTALGKFPFEADGIHTAVAISSDLKTIEHRQILTPFNSKATVLFPEKVNGKITVMTSANTDLPPAKVSIAQFDSIEDMLDHDQWNTWYENIDDHWLKLRRDDSEHVELGTVPIKTEHGWLIFYSHIGKYFSEDKIFGIEAVLLDLTDPSKIIGRTEHPIMVPEEVYEKYGYIKNVVFPTGSMLHGDLVYIYYGATDTTTCRASIKLKHLLEALLPEKKMKLVQRSLKNPILSPSSMYKWEARDVFNPAAIDIDGNIYILYRAMSTDNTSTVGLAVTSDGETIDERLPEPIYVPRADFELKKGDPNGNSGCEDPRVTRIDDTIYMLYTAYDGVQVPRVAATSISVKDFLARKWDKWAMPVLLTPRDIDDKDACLLEGKAYGQYMILHRVAHHICADTMDDLSFDTSEINKCIEIMEPRRGMWDSLKVGIASPPHKTDDGWLLLYHGVSDNSIYRVGAVLLDLDDPTKTIGRTALPIFEPKEAYEHEGEIPHVVFPCGSVIRDDTMYIYYGGADRVVGVAMTSVSKLISLLKH